MAKQSLNINKIEPLIKVLKARFEKNFDLHSGLEWKKVETKLRSNLEALWVISNMDETKGEPDVVIFDPKSKDIIYVDTSTESPDRRSLCYDREALNKRKENKPKNSVIDMANEIGITLLDEAHYIALQKLGAFDLKTESWILTPKEFRTLGGALYANKRFNRTFIGQNSAESYYSSRGFRGMVKI
jgi:hypothetical protein